MDHRQDELILGIRQAFPIILGYIPVGLALGVMASSVGFSIGQMAVMSLFVYAGSAQFIAVNMLSIGAAPITIILTTFLVNLRHLLFSASLSQHFRRVHRKFIPIISYFITDESFAVSITDVKERELSQYYFFGLYITSYLSWVISTILGVALGNLIADTKALGFDFALPGMFLTLLCMQLTDLKSIIVALISGALSLGLFLIFPGNWNVIIATILAAGLGVITEKWMSNQGTS